MLPPAVPPKEEGAVAEAEDLEEKIVEVLLGAVEAISRPKPMVDATPPPQAEIVVIVMETMAAIHVISRANHRIIRISNQPKIKVGGGRKGGLVRHPSIANRRTAQVVFHTRNHPDRTHISSARNVMPSPCPAYSIPKRTINSSCH